MSSDIKLPEGFEWHKYNIGDKEDLKQITQLIQGRYIGDGSFKLFYNSEFLEWCLNKSACWGIRIIKNKNPVGFISANTITLCISGEIIKCLEIDFLCIHPKLRHKKMTNVLVLKIQKEISDIKIAFFTGAEKHLGYICEKQIYHFPINYKKLLNLGFTGKPNNLQIKGKINSGFVEVEKKNIKEVYDFVQKEIKQNDLYQIYSQEEFEYYFINSNCQSFVLKDGNKIVGFISYFKLPYMCLKKEKFINTAYLQMIIGDYDILAQQLIINLRNNKKISKIDVVNSIFKIKNFRLGTGTLYYHLYNKIPAKKIEKVMKQSY